MDGRTTSKTLIEVKEENINKFRVITGSVPNSFDYFIDSLIKAVVIIFFWNKNNIFIYISSFINKGFNVKDITNYVLKMIDGTIKLNLESNKSPFELGKEVLSPGGSIIEGVNVLL